MSQLEQEIRQFLGDNFVLIGDANALDGGASLTRTGVIDSTGVMEVILFLETTYGIDVPDEDAVPENMDTVDSIARYVEAKLAARSEPRYEDVREPAA